MTARIDDSLVNICNELRQREMITNHTYRLLYQQSTKKSGKVATATCPGPGSVISTVERIELLLLSMMVHVDSASGLIDFWPLTQRSEVRSYRRALGRRPVQCWCNKRLYKIWTVVARASPSMYSVREASYVQYVPKASQAGHN